MAAPIAADTSNKSYIAWLGRMVGNNLPRMEVDGKEWFVLAETDVVFDLAAVACGWQHRNGWYPQQTLHYKG